MTFVTRCKCKALFQTKKTFIDYFLFILNKLTFTNMVYLSPLVAYVIFST